QSHACVLGRPRTSGTRPPCVLGLLGFRRPDGKMRTAVTTKRFFVGGRWTDALAGETFTAESPATGEAIGGVPKGDRDDAQVAIEAANRAAAAWSRLSAFDRAVALNRVAEVVERRREELAHTLTLDQGKPIAESRDEVEELVQYWRNAAEDGK